MDVQMEGVDGVQHPDLLHVWTIVASHGHASEADKFSGLSRELSSDEQLFLARSCSSDSLLHKHFMYTCHSGDLKRFGLLLPHAEKRQGLRAQTKQSRLQPIHLAAIRGHAAIVERLLLVAADLADSQDATGSTALHLACSGGNITIAQLLLKHTDVNVTDTAGRTPLMLAARAGHTKLLGTILLTQEGVKIEQGDVAGETLLVHAIRSGKPEAVHMVLAHGAAVDALRRCLWSRTLLHYACLHGIDFLVSVLLTSGADMDAADGDGKTPFILACEGGHVSTVRLLAKHMIDRRIKMPDFWAVRVWRYEHYAAANGHTAVLQALEELACEYLPVDLTLPTDARGFNSMHVTPLNLACERGHKDTITFLLQQHTVLGFHQSEEKRLEYPLLHWCCAHGYTEAVRALLGPAGEPLHIKETYLEHKASAGVDSYHLRVDLRTDGGFRYSGPTPLGHAIERGHVDIVRLLMEAGASTTAVTHDGHSALVIAARQPSTSADMLQCLLAVPGVDVDAPDGAGQYPLVASAVYRAIRPLSLLLDAGADPNVIHSDSGCTALLLVCQQATPDVSVVQLLCDRAGEGLNARDPQGRTALMQLMLRNPTSSIHAFRTLLAAPGLDTSIVSNDGVTALSLAATLPHTEYLQALLDHGLTVEPLLAATPTRMQGGTYLHAAVAADNVLAVEKLLEAGADVDARDDDGCTALMLASGTGNPCAVDAVKLLLDQGKADVNLEDSAGRPAAFYAVFGCRPDPARQAKQSALSHQLLPLLEAHGAVLDVAKKYKVSTEDAEPGCTLLHLLCMRPVERGMRIEASVKSSVRSQCQKLLELGADVNARAPKGRTPLMLACVSRLGHVVEALLTAPSIGVNAQDDKGRTALMLANDDAGCLGPLMRHPGTDLAIRDNKGNTKLVVMLSSQYCDSAAVMRVFEAVKGAGLLNTADRYSGGRTLLHAAASFVVGDELVVRLLGLTEPGLQVDVNARDDDGATPLLLAAKESRDRTVRALLGAPGIDILAVDNRCRTALMNGCDPTKVHVFGYGPEADGETVRLLLQAWPQDRRNDKDQDGHTAFTLACKAGAANAIDSLIFKAPEHVDTSVVAEGRTGLEWSCASGCWALTSRLAAHATIPSVPDPESPEQVERRVADLSCAIAGFMKEERELDRVKYAGALAQQRPRTLAELKMVNGMPQYDPGEGSMWHRFVDGLAALAAKLRLA